MTTYEIQHMRGWRRFARTVRAASRAEAERLCLPGSGWMTRSSR